MADTLSIDRFAVGLHVLATPERAALIARRIDDCVTRDLPRSLGRCHFGRADDPRRVFIDRLAIDCAINAAWSDDDIARVLARRLLMELDARLVDAAGAGSGRQGTLAFRDRSEYLAAFLIELVAGSAWRRWCFSELDGLASLDPSAAIRTLIMNEQDDGLAALARLTEASARTVLAVLVPADASRLLRWIAARPTRATIEPARAWTLSAALARDFEPEAMAGAWLSVLVASERQAPGSAGRESAEMLDALVCLRRACRARDVVAETLDPSCPLASLRALVLRFGGSAGWLDGRSEDDADLAAIVASLRETLVATTDAGAGATDTAKGESAVTDYAGLKGIVRLATRHGGAFVLLDLLTRLGWPQAWRDTLAQAGASAPDVAARALALAVVADALSSDDAGSVLGDPAMHLAIGCEDPAAALRRQHRHLRALQTDGARTWRLQSWVGAAARALREALSRRLPGLSHSTPAYLRRNLLMIPATIERRGARVRLWLGRPPLDVLLAFAGYKRGSWSLPGGPIVEVLAEEPGA